MQPNKFFLEYKMFQKTDLFQNIDCQDDIPEIVLFLSP